MKVKFIYIVILLLVISCRTVNELDFFIPNDTALADILPLEATVDIDNLNENISCGNISISGYYNGIFEVTGKYDSINVAVYDENFNKKDYQLNRDKYYTEFKFVPEIRVYDIIKLFSREVYGNYLDTTREYLGSIDLELISFKETRSFGLTIFSAWTLFVPSLIGVPINNIKTTISIKVDILNSNNELIRTYNGYGKGNAYIAMYWGYGNDAWRKSSIIAFKEAVQFVKKQIYKESSYLKSELIK